MKLEARSDTRIEERRPDRRGTKRWTRATAAFVLLSLVAVACGDDDEAATTTTAPTATSTTAAGGTPAQLSSDPASLVATGEQPEETDLTTAIPGLSILWVPVWLGIDEGLFKKHGLNVTEIQAQSTRTLDMYLANELNISFAAPGTVSALLASKQAVNVYGLIQESLSYGFWVQPEINRLEDLKGKVIGTSGVGGVPEQAAMGLLEREGLDPDDFNFQALAGIGDILTGMLSGNVAAGAFGNPLAGRAERAGLKKLFDFTKLAEPFTIAGGPIIADPGWVKENPNTAKAWLRAFFEGMQIALTDRDKTLAVLAKRVQLDPVTDADILDASYKELLSVMPSPTDSVGLEAEHLAYFKDSFEQSERIGDVNAVIPGPDGVLDELMAERYFEHLEAVYGKPPAGSYAATST